VAVPVVAHSVLRNPHLGRSSLSTLRDEPAIELRVRFRIGHVFFLLLHEFSKLDAVDFPLRRIVLRDALLEFVFKTFSRFS